MLADPLLWGNTLAFSAANPNGVHGSGIAGVGETPELINVRVEQPCTWNVFCSVESTNAPLPVSLSVFLILRIGIGRMMTRTAFFFTNGPAPPLAASVVGQLQNIPANFISGVIQLATVGIGTDTWNISLAAAPVVPLDSLRVSLAPQRKTPQELGQAAAQLMAQRRRFGG